MSEVDVRQGGQIRVSAEIGPQASIAHLEQALSWLGSVERIARFAEGGTLRGADLAQSAGTIESVQRHPSRRARPARREIWVERLRFENPLEVLLGGALSVLVYRLIIVVRDWKTEQRARNARAGALEASAWEAHQVAERRRLENMLIEQLMTHISPGDERSVDVVRRLLAQGVHDQLHVLADPPKDLDAEVVDG